jgi:hypothetical protein
VEEVDEIVIVLNGVTLGGTREQLGGAGVISTIVLVVKVLGLLGRRRRS